MLTNNGSYKISEFFGVRISRVHFIVGVHCSALSLHACACLCYRLKTIKCADKGQQQEQQQLDWKLQQGQTLYRLRESWVELVMKKESETHMYIDLYRISISGTINSLYVHRAASPPDFAWIPRWSDVVRRWEYPPFSIDVCVFVWVGVDYYRLLIALCKHCLGAESDCFLSLLLSRINKNKTKQKNIA